MTKYRILALDGGGMRGLVTVIILQRLLAEFPDLLDHVDLIAGTSSGSLIGLGIARGLDPVVVRELFELSGPKIFKDTFWDDVLDLGNLIGADYSLKPLQHELQRMLGPDTTLADLEKRVLVPAFDLDSGDKASGYQPLPRSRRKWKPKLFHNFAGSDSDGHRLAWKVALYSSAAPTYFPIADGFVDGGVFATNPSMCALAQTQDPRSLPDPPAVASVRILNVGAGYSPQVFSPARKDLGIAQWARPLVDIFLTGTSDVPAYECRQLLRGGHHRIQPVIERNLKLKLDSVSAEKIGKMVDIGMSTPLEDEATGRSTLDFIREAWLD